MKQTKEDQLLAETYNIYVVKENVVKDALADILDKMPKTDRDDPNVVGSMLHSFMDQLESEGPYNDYAAYGIKMALKDFNIEPGVINDVVNDRAGFKYNREENAETPSSGYQKEIDIEGEDGNVYIVRFNAEYGNKVVDHDPGWPPSGIKSRDIVKYGPVEVTDYEVVQVDGQDSELPVDYETAKPYLQMAWDEFISNEDNWQSPPERNDDDYDNSNQD